MATLTFEATASVSLMFECTCGMVLNAYEVREGHGLKVLQVEPCSACIEEARIEVRDSEDARREKGETDV